ncbi:cofactor assembly of complex C subunit B [Gloeobacter morelensis]|uniref:Cofactor assembly of complex C subunit B n=1 Tax=Gloeobacter morelensis MG652769 TaxID=2781736 RepID=A0ABY3PQU4_9CYAN|nr:cofactor assembly of complex C subunit B [Gloeobacter morelensis]UFP95991.1 cofactor assembly of complex C subunit B [Gloeobacter morelensis MG652769]
MQQVTILSTLVLTLLLLVGLFFFLRASVKDRTEEAELDFSSQPQQLAHSLRAYLEGRSYRLVEEQGRRLVFSGVVAPSRFLAIFLTLLALLGLICLALVLAILLPAGEWAFALLPLLSPLAGLFYWRKARRPEQVVARIVATSQGAKLVIQAHRDEILVLKDTLETANG